MKKVNPVFLDMDGVLVDWLGGIRKFRNEPDSIYDCFRKKPSKLNHDAVDELYGGKNIIDVIQLQRPVEWWLNLEFFPWSRHLINELRNNFPLCFLTSPGNCVNAAKAKLSWQLQHFSDIPIFIGKHKYLAASPTKVLIDDDQWQLDKFKLAGGLAIRWPNQFEMEKFTKNKQIQEYIDEIIYQIKEYEINLK